MDFETQSILYDVIIILIDAYIDDENEYQRLIKRINNRTSKEIIENFNPFVGLEESLEYANTRISNLEDKNSTLKNRNSTLEAEKSALKERNTNLESESYNLKLEVEKLKNKLNGN